MCVTSYFVVDPNKLVHNSSVLCYLISVSPYNDMYQPFNYHYTKRRNIFICLGKVN